MIFGVAGNVHLLELQWLGDNLERHSVGITCKQLKGIFDVRLI